MFNIPCPHPNETKHNRGLVFHGALINYFYFFLLKRIIFLSVAVIDRDNRNNLYDEDNGKDVVFFTPVKVLTIIICNV